MTENKRLRKALIQLCELYADEHGLPVQGMVGAALSGELFATLVKRE